MTDESGTMGGAGVGFDPARPCRIRLGHEVTDLQVDRAANKVSGMCEGRRETWRLSDGAALTFPSACRYGLVNAPPAVKDEGETDAAFVERMARDTTLVDSGDPPNTFRDAEHDRLISLARRAALVPDAEAVPAMWVWRTCPTGSWTEAVDEEDARACAACWGEGEALPLYTAPPATPAPVSPAGGEVSEAEVEAGTDALEALLKEEAGPVTLTADERGGLRRDAEAVLQAAARARPASLDGEGRRRAVLTIIRDQPLHPDMRTDFRQDWVKDEIARKVAALSAPAPAAPPDAIATARADEREKCARVADKAANVCLLTRDDPLGNAAISDALAMEAANIATAIRALGPVPPTDAGGVPFDDGLGNPLRFTYRNHRGEDATRTVRPISVRYGTTEWHPEPCWLLRAYDLDKQAEREFAMADIGKVADAGGGATVEGGIATCRCSPDDPYFGWCCLRCSRFPDRGTSSPTSAREP